MIYSSWCLQEGCSIKYGPACAKALCPHVLVDFGMIRAREVDERKFRAGIYGWTREILYWGAEPWTQWKISNKILKTMRSLIIGSQCRDCKIGVMWVRLGDNVTMRAQWRHQGGHGGANAPQVKGFAPPPHLPPQSEWDFFFFFFFFFFYFFFFLLMS